MYELTSFQMLPGGPAVWGHAFQAAVSVHANPGYAHLVGVFNSEFGPLNTGEPEPLSVMWEILTSYSLLILDLPYFFHAHCSYVVVCLDKSLC